MSLLSLAGHCREPVPSQPRRRPLAAVRRAASRFGRALPYRRGDGGPENTSSMPPRSAATRRLRAVSKGIAIVALCVFGLFSVTVLFPTARRVLNVAAGGWVCDSVRTAWHRAVCRVLGVRIRVSGTPAEQTVLWVANHISWVDIIALGAVRPMRFVAKQEVAGWPVFGYLARRCGTLFVRRGDAGQNIRVTAEMTRLLRDGTALTLFPEGTTTDGTVVKRFHRKFFHPALNASVPVQPISLHYRGEAAATVPFIGEDEFLPHLLRLLMLDEIPLDLRFGALLPAGQDAGRLARQAHGQVVAGKFGGENLEWERAIGE